MSKTCNSWIRASGLIAIIVWCLPVPAFGEPAGRIQEPAGYARARDAGSLATTSDPPSQVRKKRNPSRTTKPGSVMQAQHAESDDLPGGGAAPDDPLKSRLEDNVVAIDLYSALRLAGEQNPQLLIAQQRVAEAVALRQLAAAQFLPTLNLGTNYFNHTGVLQQPSGNILSVSAESLYLGAGASLVGAGTVNIPGVMWNLNVSDSIYNYLVSKKSVDRSAFQNRTTEQDVLLSVALTYTDLVRAEGNRSVAILSRNDAAELARITAAYRDTGQGRAADANRAATERALREADVVRAEGSVVSASAALCRLLHLDPIIRLHATDNYVVPRSVVPEPIPLPELLAIALLCRPELNERRVAVAQALLTLHGAKVLPFSPTLMVGFSAGSFGGGSNLVAQPVGTSPFATGAPRFGNFGDREEFDVTAYWTLRNLGVGNKAQIATAASRLRSSDLAQLETLDRIRAEVAGAYARTHVRFAQIQTCELAMQSGRDGFLQDMTRVKGQEGLPLEAINSLRLLARSRAEYLRVILDYNVAHIQLYVALGKPAADLLIRPAGDAGQTGEDQNRTPPEE